MAYNNRLILHAVVLVTLVAGVAATMASSVTPVFHNSKEGEKLMSGCAEFALAMYKNIAASEPGNIFFSPVSISMALAMTYLGARNKTQAQMKAGLSFSKLNDNELHKSFSDLRTALKGDGDQYKLHIANRLFGQKTYRFLDEFVNATRDLYGAELRTIDFIGDRNAAVAEINGWVKDQTNETIKEIVPLDAVSELTRLILVNAIYFKGDWIKKFDAALTKDENFHVDAGEKVKVPLMHMKKANFLYGVNETINCQVLELPYNGSRLSMIILLPNQTVTNLSDVERQLTAEHLINVRKTFDMSSKDVNLWLPKLKLEKSLDLKEALERLGIVDVFQENKADLSGIDGSEDLYVSKVLHKAFVEVNEEGSEAAAATSVDISFRSAAIAPQEPVEFRADRPFLFFLLDNTSKSILFFGRFLKP